MQHTTYLKHNKKGQEIFEQSWTGEKEPIAVICHIHGQSDHSSRFEHVAQFFVAHQVDFYAADLIGHGKSGGARGHVNKFEEYLETVDMLYADVTARYPGKPIFIYGHSMGGNVVINHALQNKQAVAGYIATSPWIRLAFEPPAWKVALGKTVKSIFPALLQPTGLNPDLISHDKVVVEKYKNDKLVHGKISAAGFFEILTHGKSILTRAGELHYPLFIAHGTEDRLTDHNASSEFAAMRPDLITYKAFTGLYHEMHNEAEKEDLFNAILHFIHQKIQ
ncbi:MAG: lysophospholipase [Chitinophagales bacterium]